MENPYTPEAGATPRELVGREGLRKAFTSLLDGLERGHAQQSQLITGLRGTGKTALLRDYVRTARARRWAVVDIDAAKRDNQGFRRQLSFEFRSVLLAISPRSRWKPAAVAASGVLGSFASLLGADSPLTSEWTELTPGSADTGNLSADTTQMLLAIGEAAQDHNTGVVLVVDEIQQWTTDQLGALIDGLHRTYLRELPVALVGAGIPRSDMMPADTQVRADRLFDFPVLDPLTDADVAKLLGKEHEWNDHAVATAVEITGGVPVFIQALGFVVWEKSGASPVTESAVSAVSTTFEEYVDREFFGAMLTRATELEVAYLRATVESSDAAEAARLLSRTAHQCSTTRAGLVDKGWIHLEADGSAAFTAPGFAGYLSRAMPRLKAPAVEPRRRRYDP